MITLNTDEHNRKMFKATLAITIAYAVVAVVLLGIGMFNQEINRRFGTFFLTLTAGMFAVVVIMLIVLAFNWNLKRKVKRSGLPNESYYDCPDYYRMVQKTVGDKDESVCVANRSVYPTRAFGFDANTESPARFTAPNGDFDAWWKDGPNATNTIGLSKDTTTYTDMSSDVKEYIKANASSPNYKQFTPASQSHTISTGTVCSMIFPDKLREKETSTVNESGETLYGNDIRCQYAQACGVPWSSLCLQA